MEKYVKLLGYKAQDRVTGFSGTIASVSFDLYGCIQLVLTPEVDKDGKSADGHWFDYSRLAINTDNPPVLENPYFPVVNEKKGPTEKPRHRAI